MLKSLFLSLIVVLFLSGILFAKSIESDKNLKKVTYSLSEASLVIVTLYEADGAELKTLVNEFKEAGEYQITIPMDDLAGGLYYVGIEAGKYIEFKQLNLQD